MKTLAFLILARISTPRTLALRRDDVIAVAAFALLCAFYGAWPIWRAFFPLEIDLKEPWDAYHADAVFNGGMLYPDLAGLTANNYPPLWYYLTSALSCLGVDAIYVGRALSFAAVVALVVTIALCIRRFNAGWPAAVLGGLFFFGTMVRFADWYVAMNDPHLPALALMMIALLWFLSRDPARSPVPPLLLMVAAGFFKQALVAIPAMTLFLLARRNTRIALRAATVSGCAALAVIAVFTAIHGIRFVDQIFFYPREISFERGWNSIARIGVLAPALAFCAIWIWNDRRSEAARFGAIFVGFAFAAYLLQKVGAGVDVNAAFELIAAVAVAIGLAFDRIARVPVFSGMNIEIRRIAMVGVLGLTLVAAPGLEPYFLFASPDYRAQFSVNSAVMRAEVQRIAAIPGAVLCSIDSVCRAAGKPFTLDVFFIAQRGATGRLTVGELRDRAQGIRYEAIDPRASLRPLQRQLFYGRAQ
jgi:hypothetical protein